MEVMCIIYSMIDGKKIKSWNIVNQELAQNEYRERKSKEEEVAYFEGPLFPLDDFRFKFNSSKKIFEFKNDKELLDEGSIELKKYEKIVNNKIIAKEPYEMYNEGLILNQPSDKVYKINKSNRVVRKNILELIEINFDDNYIKDGILEKVSFLLDSLNHQSNKKYPEFEYINFNYKSSTAHLWDGLTEPAKLRILRSDSRINSFNILIAEFYNQLTEEDKKNPQVLLIKMNETATNIIKYEGLYFNKQKDLLEARNNFTKKLRELTISKESIIQYIEEVNNYFGKDSLNIEDIELSPKYYITIPYPNMDFYV